jgi:predicted nucleic acid-binding Zn ribbon protein
MNKIGHVLQNMIREMGLSKPMQKYRALEIWPEVVGEKISRITEAKRFSDGKLIIQVNNAAWRNELHFYKEEIREKVNRRLGTDTVKEILFI